MTEDDTFKKLKGIKVRVEYDRSSPYSGYYMYKWLDENIGEKGNGWTNKTETIKHPNGTIWKQYIELDNEEDAVAYKLRFNV